MIDDHEKVKSNDSKKKNASRHKTQYNRILQNYKDGNIGLITMIRTDNNSCRGGVNKLDNLIIYYYYNLFA